MRSAGFLVLLFLFSNAAVHAGDPVKSDWLEAPQPPYPIVSALHKISGVVRLRLVLRDDGRVKEAVVAHGSGSERLDAAARMAALNWRLNPAKLKPSDVTVGRVIEIEFKRQAHDIDVARAVLLKAGERGSAWKKQGRIQFPSSARIFYHKPGRVLLGATIGFDGHPGAVEVLESSGYPPYDRAAAEGIQTWQAYPQFVGESFKVPVVFAP